MKNTIKFILVNFYSQINKNIDGKVLYYHDIFKSVQYTNMGTHLKLFMKHIDVIYKNGFCIVNRLPYNTKEINICLDDAWAGIWEVRDYFIDNKIFPTIFVALDLIGKDGYLSLKQILFLQNEGFNFQSHTCSHRDLTSLNSEELIFELAESKRKLSIILNKEIDSICYPMGFYNGSILSLSFSLGYKYIYLSVPGSCIESNTIINRNLVQDASPKLLKNILYGGLDVLKKRTNKRHNKYFREL